MSIRKQLSVKRLKQISIGASLILILGFVLHKDYINEFPSHIHAWAQADRYALALGFVDNNLNFFKPETFIFNHQFPYDWNVPSKESITPVDFPIHDFIPAIIMKLTSNTSAWIFRLYILIYGFVGLFYLYRLSMLLTADHYKSIFISIIATTSPVFAYYHSSFLPSIPSLANAFIGLFFYTSYIYNNKNKYFNLMILFLSLAVLSRTTFAIFFTSILGLELLRIIQRKSQIKPKIIPVLLSISSILFFYFYNALLRAEYGSDFLSHLRIAESFQEAIEILKIVKERWLYQYFSMIHYFIFSFLIIAFTFLIVQKKAKIQKEQLTIFYLSHIFLLACLVFAFLMLRQFPDHDYYFLDTFFLPIILYLIIIISVIPFDTKKHSSIIYKLSIVIISILLIINAFSTQKSRRIIGYWDGTMETVNNFTGAKIFLDSLGIPKDSKILVLDAHAPNLPFILMGRKGFTNMSCEKDVIQKALTWDYDYIVLQNEFFLSNIYYSYPEILRKIKKIADNGKISVCKLNKIDTAQTLAEFIGIQGKTPVFKTIINYDTIADESWHNTNPTTDTNSFGENYGVLTKNMEYGITFKTKNLPAITEKKRRLLFNAKFLHDTLNSCKIVVSINENKNRSYLKVYELSRILKSKNKWEEVNLLFQLPKVKNEDYELSIYIWNTGRNNLFIDDFGFELY